MNGIVLCTLVLNEMEWLPRLWLQHKDWPDLLGWVFVESADVMYAKANPERVTGEGLSTDGTTEFLKELAARDERVSRLAYGFSDAADPAQGKCEARTACLRVLDAHGWQPDFLFVLDADEFYPRADQARIMDVMASYPSRTGFCFKQRQIWHPAALAGQPRFAYEVTGGFWDIPHARGWRWQPGLRYRKNHNTPETAEGQLLDQLLQRLDRQPDTPQCVHMGWASALASRAAKNRYYELRGESVDPKRRWYTESRAAWENWQPGQQLPRGARVLPYVGPIPECFEQGGGR